MNRTMRVFEQDHKNSKRIPIKNHDDPLLVAPEQYDYLVQFEWRWHHLSDEAVVYVDVPYVGTRMVFGTWLALTLAGRVSWGNPQIIPLHGTNAKSTRLTGAFIRKEDFEKFARKRQTAA